MTGLDICSIILTLLCLTSATTAEEGVWTRKADMPTPRYGLSANMVNGKIYVIGGTQAAPWEGISTVEEYDPATDTISTYWKPSLRMGGRGRSRM